MAADILPLPATYRPLLCSLCKCLLQDPITLPCGFSLCSDCLPASEEVDFQQQIRCPFPQCARSRVHLAQELRVDVTLQKLTLLLRENIALKRNRVLRQRDVFTNPSVEDHPTPNKANTNNTPPHNRSLPTSAQEIILQEDIDNARAYHQPEHLYYGDDTTASSTGWPATLDGLFDPYDPSDRNGKFDKPETIPRSHIPQRQDLDPVILQRISQEVECQICFLPFYKPITTRCGHTLCKACLVRALDHASCTPTCPLCRTSLPLYPYYYNQRPNKTLSQFIEYLRLPLPANVDAASIEQENTLEPALAALPLFINSLVYPKMPCFLHIFEPRYRRLLRNVLKTEAKIFGMVLPPRHTRKRIVEREGVGRRSHGHGSLALDYQQPSSLGGGDLHSMPWEPSMSHGVILRVVSFEPLMDGRALVETVAIDRFQILTYAMLDGYHTATAIEFVHDIPQAHESGLERQRILHAARQHHQQQQQHGVRRQQRRQHAESTTEGAVEGVDLTLEDDVVIADPGRRHHRQASIEAHASSVQQEVLSEKAGDADLAGAPPPPSSSSSSESASATLPAATNSTVSPTGAPIESPTSPTATSATPATTATGTGSWAPRRLRDMELDTLTRKQLAEILVAFVFRMQEQLGPMVMARLEREHGELVLDLDDEAMDAQLTFWVARALPIPTYELYELLTIVSVRDRSLRVVRWLRDLEMQRSSSVCSIQ
ncbi:hypothetical protein BGZ73_002162 [Actinomortierella ambigua]|nr:hypothetical protein BGZ73_002162 [Actinomortierella ambigua]